MIFAPRHKLTKYLNKKICINDICMQNQMTFIKRVLQFILSVPPEERRKGGICGGGIPPEEKVRRK